MLSTSIWSALICTQIPFEGWAASVALLMVTCGKWSTHIWILNFLYYREFGHTDSALDALNASTSFLEANLTTIL